MQLAQAPLLHRHVQPAHVAPHALPLGQLLLAGARREDGGVGARVAARLRHQRLEDVAIAAILGAVGERRAAEVGQVLRRLRQRCLQRLVARVVRHPADERAKAAERARVARAPERRRERQVVLEALGQLVGAEGGARRRQARQLVEHQPVDVNVLCLGWASSDSIDAAYAASAE